LRREHEHDPDQPADQGHDQGDQRADLEPAPTARRLVRRRLRRLDSLFGRAEPFEHVADCDLVIDPESISAASMCSRISATSSARRDGGKPRFDLRP
jgi:hypothetical protein